MEKRIITIGRECGSGGHTIAKLVAEQLGIAFYDKEIVEMVAAKTKLSPEFIASHGEYFRNGSIGHIFGYGARFAATVQTQSSIQDQMHFVQTDLIREIAEKEPCVIVGRCADYILREMKPIRIFVYADMNSRIARCRARAEADEGLSDRQMKKRILEVDRNRARYYRYYTGQIWGDRSYYDLCINTTNTDIKAAAHAVAMMIRAGES